MSLATRIGKYGKQWTDVGRSTTLPCYSQRLHTPPWCDTAEKILDVVDGVMEDQSHGILLISVTNRDTYYQLWLDTISEVYEEASITESVSRHADYKVWMICIPMYD